MKFIKTLAGEYVRVDAVNKFVIEYDCDAQKFYVMAITAEDTEDLSVHEEKYQAQNALDDLLAAINGCWNKLRRLIQ